VSESTFFVSVEGTELSTWESTFRSALSALPEAHGLEVFSVHSSGTFGAKRGGGRVKVKSGGEPPSFDRAVNVVGVVIAALTLAIAAHEMKHEPVKPSMPSTAITCTIEGPKGSRELRIENAGVVHDGLVRACLADTGYPKSIKAKPDAK
jgi:hypothetical protein